LVVAGTYYDGATLFVNAALCDVNYQIAHSPVVIDLPLDRTLPAVLVQD
jgi:hypothetical protein